jgi:hypothetical protein
MHPHPQDQPISTVSSLLPADWSAALDVLLIVGEGAGAISQPFVSHGLTRVIAMFPPPLTVETVAEGAMAVNSRGALCRAINTMTGPEPGRFAMIRTPSCSLSNEDTETIRQLTATLLKAKRGNTHIHSQLAPRWAANGLRNLTTLGHLPMVTDIGDAFKGMPMIIVGAGPSLAKNIDQLKAAQGKAIIVCVARALRSLQAEGVWPDFAISLDATEVRCQFRGIAMDRVPGVMISATSHPELLALPDTTLLSYSSNTEADGWMFDPQDGVKEMPSGGSVSCSAMSIGLHWGCSPIVLVGQDLSFSGGAFYHAGGTDGDTQAIYDEATNTWTLEGYSEDLAHTLRDRIAKVGMRTGAAEVPGYFGGMVPTNPAFASFRTWFEFTAFDHQTPMFNCTEGGAHIGGMAHMPLSVVMADLAPRTVDIRAIVDRVRVAPILTDRNQRYQARGKHTWAAIKAAQALAMRCIQIIDKASRQPSVLPQLQPIEAKLSAAIKRAFVLNLMAQDDIRSAIAEGREATDLKASLAASRKLYQVILDHSSQLTQGAQ